MNPNETQFGDPYEDDGPLMDLETSSTSTPPPGIILSPEQNHAIDLILTWFHKSPNQVWKLGGYAGTGKTTLLKHLRECLSLVDKTCHVCAFTGKACSVLQRKGLPAYTIHSSIYFCEMDSKGTYTFEKRVRLESQPDLIIVDEASMISTELWRDLLSFGVKILCVGDPGQLEPVGDNPNLMHTQDYCLTKIHRQAEKSPILTLAHNVRTTGNLPPFKETPELSIRPKSLDYKRFTLATQVICAKNATRNAFNSAIRGVKGFKPATIQLGEKIICLKNNMRLGVYNGLICFVSKVEDLGDYFLCDMTDEVGNVFKDLKVWKAPFIRQLTEGEYCPPFLAHFDYAYAITCHKSQGSEWENVIVYFEWMPPKVWDNKRWLYTAITRASKTLALYK